MRTADKIAEQQEQQQSSADSEQAPKQSRTAHLVKWQWGKGQSGNPGGRPKKDFAAEFARQVMEAQGDEKKLSEYANGFAAQLSKGNAYTFKELADRGYGKLKESLDVSGLDAVAIALAEARKRRKR